MGDRLSGARVVFTDEMMSQIPRYRHSFATKDGLTTTMPVRGKAEWLTTGST